MINRYSSGEIAQGIADYLEDASLEDLLTLAKVIWPDANLILTKNSMDDFESDIELFDTGRE